MDIKTTFLNVKLDKEIYMEQSEGFNIPRQENKACKLIKSLYGLNKHLNNGMRNLTTRYYQSGFKINECDKGVYTKINSKKDMLLYVSIWTTC